MNFKNDIHNALWKSRYLHCHQKAIFQSDLLNELFENIKIDDVLSFLRKTGLYEKIWRIKTD